MDTNNIVKSLFIIGYQNKMIGRTMCFPLFQVVSTIIRNVTFESKKCLNSGFSTSIVLLNPTTDASVICNTTKRTSLRFQQFNQLIYSPKTITNTKFIMVMQPYKSI